MRELITELTETLRAARPVVYCAVAATRGSTPQKAGAVMLVYPDGRQSGTLGGGCVEADVKRRALAALNQKVGPEIVSFTLDSDYGWDDGLICGGRMDLLVEPLHGGDGLDYYERFQNLVDEGHGGLEAVLLQSGHHGADCGARFLFDHAGEFVTARHADAPAPDIRRHVIDCPAAHRPWTREHVAYLPLRPRCRLLIVGGGHVGHAVAQLARQADFDIWVVDDRQAYANAERFPDAERVIVGDVGPTLRELRITPNTFCLIVTRGHAHDEEALLHLADRGARYVGMIGSKRKIRLIFEDLLAAGVPQAALDNVHAPVGIDIGSQTVPEIAVSIVAELIARRNLGHATPTSFRSEAVVSGA